MQKRKFKGHFEEICVENRQKAGKSRKVIIFNGGLFQCIDDWVINPQKSVQCTKIAMSTSSSTISQYRHVYPFHNTYS